MAARNYKPTLRRLSRLLNLFIARYQTQILSGASPEFATAIAGVQAALEELIAEIGDLGGV